MQSGTGGPEPPESLPGIGKERARNIGFSNRALHGPVIPPSSISARKPGRETEKEGEFARSVLVAIIACHLDFAEKSRDLFGRWCTSRGYAAADTLERDWNRTIAFYDFPKEHWKHLRTNNPIKSPFAYLRLRTDAAKRFKKVDNAIAVIWKLLLIGEKKFRILTAANLLKDVYYGVKFEDGVRISTEAEEVAA